MRRKINSINANGNSTNPLYKLQRRARRKDLYDAIDNLQLTIYNIDDEQP